MKCFNQIYGAMALLALCGILNGCSGGGASEIPTITVKPAEATSKAPETGNGPKEPKGDEPKGGYGTFKGKVVFTGSAPSLPPLIAKGASKRDPTVCAATAAIPDESFLVNGGGVANVFIYLRKAPENGKQSLGGDESQELELDQKGCIFIPHAMVVRTDQKILVKNSDAAAHNVKTSPLRNDKYEATLNQGQTGELVFGKPESTPCSAECNYHAWMKAYQLPLDHPYGVVTKANGSFEIPNLPVGTHRFMIWHERAGTIDTRYTVKIEKDGDEVSKTIEVGPDKLSRFDGPKPKTIKLTFSR